VAPPNQLTRVGRELEEARRRAHDLTSALDHERWARRPRPDRWSVAEGLIHLNLTSRAFLPLVREAIATGRNLRLFAAGPYRRDFVGWCLSWAMEPPVRLPIKTTAPFVPVGIEATDSVLGVFDALQDELMACVEDAGGLDLGRLRVASPFDSRVKYNLYACLKIIPAHQRQHLSQAEEAIRRLG
jgi:hypothetical protein